MTTRLLDRLPTLRGQVAYGRRPLAPSPPRWSLADLAGRVVELSGGGDSAALTLAMGVVAEAHRQGGNVAWVCVADPFFPPDAAAAGVDLAALAVVLLPETATAPRPGPHPAAAPVQGGGQTRRKEEAERAGRAALHLLRGGCFSVVVLDLGATPLPPATGALLARLAHDHGTALVCLTTKEQADPSLSPLVSLRLHTRRGAPAKGCFPCHLTALRDRRHGPGWRHVERYRGPAGLC